MEATLATLNIAGFNEITMDEQLAIDGGKFSWKAAAIIGIGIAFPVVGLGIAVGYLTEAANH